jgi:hypothetical protein
VISWPLSSSSGRSWSPEAGASPFFGWVCQFDNFRPRAGWLGSITKSSGERARQLLSHFEWHQQAANYCRLKPRRSAALKKIIGVWPCSRESKMHHPSSFHDIEGAIDECLWDIVRIGNFNRPCWRLHNWHRCSPLLVRSCFLAPRRISV